MYSKHCATLGICIQNIGHTYLKHLAYIIKTLGIHIHNTGHTEYIFKTLGIHIQTLSIFIQNIGHTNSKHCPYMFKTGGCTNTQIRISSLYDLFVFMLYIPVHNFSVMVETFPKSNQRIKCLTQGRT